MRKLFTAVLLMIPARYMISTVTADLIANIDNRQIATLLSLVITLLILAVCFWISSYIDLQRDVSIVKQEAEAHNRTFVEHLAKLVPDDILSFCEANKGQGEALAKGLKQFRKEKRIDALCVACLKEAFR
jgi:hypothetical protein